MMRIQAIGTMGALFALACLPQDGRGQYIGPGSTVGGDVARGLGVFYDGAGRYELNSARARSIDTDTMIRWNEYVYQSLQEHNRQRLARIAADRARKIKSFNTIRDRIRNNPEDLDLYSGDAMNIVLEDLSNPKFGPADFRSFDVRLLGGTLQTIPLQYASMGGAISMRLLTIQDGWPLPLRGKAFAAEREDYLRAIDLALEEISDKKLTPERIKALVGVVNRIKAKVETTIPRSDPLFIQARDFSKQLEKSVDLLQRPLVEDVLWAMERYNGTTVADLLDFMKRYNLRFSPATTPAERDLYRHLYGRLREQRDFLVARDPSDKK